MKATLNDFTGGLTDSPFTDPENCAEVAENVLIRNRAIETCPGITVFSPDAYRLPSLGRVQALAEVSPGEWIAISGRKLYHATSSAITEIPGPSGNNAFNAGDEDSIVSLTRANGHYLATSSARPYPVKIWKNDSGAIKVVTAGLPAPVVSGINVTSSGSGTTHLYAYAWRYEYMVGTVKFIDISPPAFKTVTNGPNYTHSSFPVLSNGADYNYDVAGIRLDIYRSVNGGSDFYQVASRTQAQLASSWTDTFSDSSVLLLDPIYTTGDVRDNDPPPPASFSFEANNTVFWGNYLTSTEVKDNRVIQAQTNDGDSVPSDFFTPFSGTVTGGGSIGRNPIVFTESETIRLDGIIDELGRGSHFPQVLSSTVGCINHRSIVKSSRGLYFASETGFYFTDGVGAPVILARRDAVTSKIGGLYRALTGTEEQRSRFCGTYDKKGSRVYWAVQESEADNDKLYVYDETNDAFTTISLGPNISPTALAMDGEDLLIGDARGYLLRLTKDAYTFPVVDTTVAPDLWDETTIMHRWKSIQFAGGDGSVNKWFRKVNVQGSPETSLDLVVKSYTNGEPEYKELYPLKMSPTLIWGDPSFTWGDSSFVWDRTSSMDQTRRFPAGRLRARTRAIEFTNAYTQIASSTAIDASRVSVNQSLKTATLLNPASYSFALNLEGYDMVIGGVKYRILSGTSDTLTLESAPSNGSYHYQIMGHPKGQRLHIRNMTIDFDTLTDTGTDPNAS